MFVLALPFRGDNQRYPSIARMNSILCVVRELTDNSHRGAGRMPCPRRQPLVEVYIVLCHPGDDKPFLKDLAAAGAAEGGDPRDGLYGLLIACHNPPGHPIGEDFW